MDLSDAISSAIATLRRRPADLLPVYGLNAAIPVIARVVTFVGLLAAYGYLEATGRLDAIREALAAQELSPPDPEAEPEAFEQWLEGLLPILEPLADPVVIGLVVGGFVGTMLLSIPLYAGVTAGQYATCFARLRGERGLTAGIRGVRRYWLTMLGLFVLEVAIVAGTLLLAAVAVALVATVSPIAAALVGLAAALVWIAVAIVARAVFAFAPVAAVVDDVGTLSSVRSAGGFVRANPMEALGYYVLAVGALFAIGSAAGALAFVEAGTIIGLLSLFVLAPALDLIKTGLVGGWREAVTPAEPVGARVRDQLRDGLAAGWRELGGFVRATPGYHAVAVGAILVGFWGGWVFAAPFEGVIETSIAARLEGMIPPTAALEFFANNWTVAIATGLSGVALALPALSSLWFNGVVFGIYARLEVAPMELLAFVAPHGIIEIPAIIIAGALGTWLGVVGWRSWRGRATREDLADALERSFHVLVGVGILLFVAGMIEGFVSPYYYGVFL